MSAVESTSPAQPLSSIVCSTDEAKTSVDDDKWLYNTSSSNPAMIKDAHNTRQEHLNLSVDDSNMLEHVDESHTEKHNKAINETQINENIDEEKKINMNSEDDQNNEDDDDNESIEVFLERQIIDNKDQLSKDNETQEIIDELNLKGEQKATKSFKQIKNIPQISSQSNSLNKSQMNQLKLGSEKNLDADFSNIFNVEMLGNLNVKSVAELDLDTLAEKPWNNPGADITDYFNYGFTETTWRAYCRKQQIIRTILTNNPNLFESNTFPIMPNIQPQQFFNQSMTNNGQQNSQNCDNTITNPLLQSNNCFGPNSDIKTTATMMMNAQNSHQLSSIYIPNMQSNPISMDYKNFPLKHSIIGYSVFCNMFDNFIPSPLTINRAVNTNTSNDSSTDIYNENCFWPIGIQNFNIFEYLTWELSSNQGFIFDTCEWHEIIMNANFYPSLYLKNLVNNEDQFFDKIKNHDLKEKSHNSDDEDTNKSSNSKNTTSYFNILNNNDESSDMNRAFDSSSSKSPLSTHKMNCNDTPSKTSSNHHDDSFKYSKDKSHTNARNLNHPDQSTNNNNDNNNNKKKEIDRNLLECQLDQPLKKQFKKNHEKNSSINNHNKSSSRSSIKVEASTRSKEKHKDKNNESLPYRDHDSRRHRSISRERKIHKSSSSGLKRSRK